MERCKENQPSGEERGECAHCWLIGTKEVHAEEGMMPFGQSSLRQLNMALLYEAMFEVMGPLHWSRSTRFIVSQSRERMRVSFLMIMWFYCDTSKGSAMSEGNMESQCTRRVCCA